MKKITLLIALTLILSSCKTMTGGGKVDSNGVSVKGQGDQLEEKITVTTRNYETPFMGVISANSADPFFRGYKHKKTNSKTYQLYATVRSTEWAFWDEIRYNHNGELKILKANRIAGEVGSCEFGCSLYEDVVVDLDMEVLKAWASSAKPITIRFGSSKISSTADTEIKPEEVKLFIEKMNSI